MKCSSGYHLLEMLLDYMSLTLCMITVSHSSFRSIYSIALIDWPPHLESRYPWSASYNISLHSQFSFEACQSSSPNSFRKEFTWLESYCPWCSYRNDYSDYPLWTFLHLVSNLFPCSMLIFLNDWEITLMVANCSFLMN